MNLPTFDDFLKSLDPGLSSDLIRYATNGLISPLNKEQLEAVTFIAFKISRAMIQEYHDWLKNEVQHQSSGQ